MNEIYIANAHIYFKGNTADTEIYCEGETKEERINAALENLRREICFHNDIELCVGGEIVLRDEDGNDIDSFTE